MEFITQNWIVIAAFLYATLELIFVFNPNLKANGVVHGIYLYIQKLLGKAPKIEEEKPKDPST